MFSDPLDTVIVENNYLCISFVNHMYLTLIEHCKSFNSCKNTNIMS